MVCAREVGRELEWLSRVGHLELATTRAEELRENWLGRKKGERVGLCRFMGAVRVAEARLPEWNRRALELFYFGIQTGALTATKYAKLLASARLVPDYDDAEGPMARGAEALKKLRAICKNTLQVATLFYADEDNHQRQAILVRVCRFVTEFQGHASKMCRSINDSMVWAAKMAGGTFVNVVGHTLRIIEDPVAVTDMRFASSFPVGVGAVQVCHPIVVQSNEMAKTAGQLVLALAANFLRKGSYIWLGWPFRFVLLTDPGDVAKITLQELREDWERYSRLLAIPGSAAAAMRKRSVPLEVRAAARARGRRRRLEPH